MSILAKILIVVTSHSQLGETGKPTGYYLPEVTHPYAAFEKTGLAIDIASPKGGNAPMDPSSLDLNDPVNKRLYESKDFRKKLENTIKLSEINTKNYVAVFYAGGHGAMWDFAQNPDVQRIAREIYEANGVVSAVCHGPAALADVKLTNGNYLVANKNVAAFSDDEEEAIALTRVVPFLLESTLKKRGAFYTKASLWQQHVVVDGNLVTGQNPASASQVGDAVAKIVGLNDKSLKAIAK